MLVSISGAFMITEAAQPTTATPASMQRQKQTRMKRFQFMRYFFFFFSFFSFPEEDAAAEPETDSEDASC